VSSGCCFIILMRFLFCNLCSLSLQSLTVQLGPPEVVHRVYSFPSREMSMTTRAVTPFLFLPLFIFFFFPPEYNELLIFKLQIFWDRINPQIIYLRRLEIGHERSGVGMLLCAVFKATKSSMASHILSLLMLNYFRSFFFCFADLFCLNACCCSLNG